MSGSLGVMSLPSKLLSSIAILIIPTISNKWIQLIICLPVPIGTPRNNLNNGYSLFNTPPSFDNTNPIRKTVVLTPIQLNRKISFSHFYCLLILFSSTTSLSKSSNSEFAILLSSVLGVFLSSFSTFICPFFPFLIIIL